MQPEGSVPYSHTGEHNRETRKHASVARAEVFAGYELANGKIQNLFGFSPFPGVKVLARTQMPVCIFKYTKRFKPSLPLLKFVYEVTSLNKYSQRLVQIKMECLNS